MVKQIGDGGETGLADQADLTTDEVAVGEEGNPPIHPTLDELHDAARGLISSSGSRVRSLWSDHSLLAPTLENGVPAVAATNPVIATGAHVAIGLRMADKVHGDLAAIHNHPDPKVRTGQYPNRIQAMLNALKTVYGKRSLDTTAWESMLDHELATAKGMTRERAQVVRFAFHKLIQDIGLSLPDWADFFNSVHGIMGGLFSGCMRDYTQGQGLMANMLLGGGGNCQANTKLTVAVLSHFGWSQHGPWQLGVQVFSDHVQPVYYNGQTREVWNLLANKVERTIKAPIFDPRILAYAFLEQNNAVPDGITPEKLRLATGAIKAPSPSKPPPNRLQEMNSNLSWSMGSGVYSYSPNPERARLTSPYGSELSGPIGELRAADQKRVEYEEKLAAAMQEFNKDPNNDGLGHHIAHYLETLGRRGEAISMLEKMIRISPDPEHIARLAIYHNRNGRPHKGLQLIEAHGGAKAHVLYAYAAFRSQELLKNPQGMQNASAIFNQAFDAENGYDGKYLGLTPGVL